MAPRPLEYRSSASLLGLPLVHVCLARRREDGTLERGVACGWVAVGPVARGVLVGVGGLATGALALGGVSFGLLALGGGALGLVSLGGLSVGFWALGGCAVGYFAIGGLALAWKAALGGAAIAREYALGGFASASHAGDDAAKQFFASAPFFQYGPLVARQSRWALLLLLLPVLLPWLGRRRPSEEVERQI